MHPDCIDARRNTGVLAQFDEPFVDPAKLVAGRGSQNLVRSPTEDCRATLVTVKPSLPSRASWQMRTVRDGDGDALCFNGLPARQPAVASNPIAAMSVASRAAAPAGGAPRGSAAGNQPRYRVPSGNFR